MWSSKLGMITNQFLTYRLQIKLMYTLCRALRILHPVDCPHMFHPCFLIVEILTRGCAQYYKIMNNHLVHSQYLLLVKSWCWVQKAWLCPHLLVQMHLFAGMIWFLLEPVERLKVYFKNLKDTIFYLLVVTLFQAAPWTLPVLIILILQTRTCQNHMH